ncbi:hypothetical protein KKG83_05595 [Candidatus Micrarchaeota archaeon]|nr:hypothetical protein [Candidatus Micrarchaeota archaeon]MBU2476918.1 hypothetical protein [Candidatus Micrarchaeota archaeon]
MRETTTIQVSRSTVHVLDRIKKKYKVSSYDKAIQRMARKEKGIKKSMFGVHPEMKKFRREEIFHDI